MKKMRRPGIPAELADAIEEFIAANPRMGVRSLSNFTAIACQRYLATLQRERYVADVVAGKIQPDEDIAEKSEL